MDEHYVNAFQACRTPILTRPSPREAPVVVKGKDSYKGCDYTVGFKVSRAIHLTGLEFYGPYNSDYVDYTVCMQVCRTEEDWTWYHRIFDFFKGGPWYRIIELSPRYTRRVRNCRKGQNFRVFFPEPVLIQPNLWTDIKFELIGPETECLKYGFGAMDAQVVDPAGVHFEFMAGSRQLPSVYFITI